MSNVNRNLQNEFNSLYESKEHESKEFKEQKSKESKEQEFKEQESKEYDSEPEMELTSDYEFNEEEYIRDNLVLGYNSETQHWHCVLCGEDLGLNSRQLCGKTFCYSE